MGWDGEEGCRLHDLLMDSFGLLVDFIPGLVSLFGDAVLGCRTKNAKYFD